MSAIKLDFLSLQVLYDLKEECQCASGGGLYYLHFDIHIIYGIHIWSRGANL